MPLCTLYEPVHETGARPVLPRVYIGSGMSIDLIAQPSFLLELGGKKCAEVSISKKAYTYACLPDCTFATLHRLVNFPSFSRLVEVEGGLEILSTFAESHGCKPVDECAVGNPP